jgi:hypothetical protein
LSLATAKTRKDVGGFIFVLGRRRAAGSVE